MSLPNGERAIVEVAKLRDYCLSPTHPRGRHKARVFAASLGITNTENQLRCCLMPCSMPLALAQPRRQQMMLSASDI
jgi:hypothetical protein